MNEVISLKDLEINEDGSFSIPASPRLEKGLGQYKSSSNDNCNNGTKCDGTFNSNCDNENSCDPTFNATKCQNPSYGTI